VAALRIVNQRRPHLIHIHAYTRATCTVNDELEMMRYRLALHRPVAVRTIILESQWSHTGSSKPLHARASLTATELAADNIRLVDVPFDANLLLRANSSSKRANAVETAHRRYVHDVLREELGRLIPSDAVRLRGGGELLVHMSDVDELLDVETLRRAVHYAGAGDGAAGVRAVLPTCRSPTLRHFYYGEHCPTATSETWYPWIRSVLFRATSPWFDVVVAHPRSRNSFQLRHLSGARYANGSWLCVLLIEHTR
jgi:hypothetical protein